MKYDDIINLPHFHAPGKPYMSNKDRAAQFMPFKSLNGFEDSIDEETSKIVDADFETIIYDERYDQDFLQGDGDDVWIDAEK